jgi:hypothetical protein
MAQYPQVCGDGNGVRRARAESGHKVHGHGTGTPPIPNVSSSAIVIAPVFHPLDLALALLKRKMW